MKKLWITILSLSMFGLPRVSGQEAIVHARGKGSCWQSSIDSNGFEIFNFIPSANRCGWFTVFQKRHDIANSPIGWNGYIKIVNPDKPNRMFYLGSDTAQRSFKFGKNSKIACYICQPDTTNCSPNDPERSSKCFTGVNKITCDQQVNCSQVLDITECYSKGEGVFAQVYNDLALCGEPQGGLLNLSGAAGPGLPTYQAQDVALSVLPTA